MTESNTMMRSESRLVGALVGALILFFTGLGQPQSAAAQASGDIERYLNEIQALADEALAASRNAENASSVSEVKRQADAVFETIWGMPSGLADTDARGAEYAHGWKTQWQVTYTDFDSAFAARYGSEPPEIQDPGRLGIVGRGRYVRRQLESRIDGSSAAASERTHGSHVVTSLNNVIGWMKMDDGVTKGERQPRVDLTREWDSPIEFWMSTSDTGWLHEVYAQAINILKTDYESDVETARDHAAGMTQLLERAVEGEDADGNGTIEPVKMEGGIRTALQHAGLAGYLQP